MKGSIIIEASDSGYAVSVAVGDVSVTDKLELMHTLSVALNMDEQDMHLYMLAETLGVMSGATDVIQCMNSDQLEAMLRGDQPEGVTIDMTEMRRQMYES